MSHSYKSRWLGLTLLSFSLMLSLMLVTQPTAAQNTVGAVSPTNAIIGSYEFDQIGSHGVYVLPSGNLVVASPSYHNNRGAVTCLTPSQYKSGGITVNNSNSLIGSVTGDYIGGEIKLLPNGNYVVLSFAWQNGDEQRAGAVTWVNGETCLPAGSATVNAVVSAQNSLVGSTRNDSDYADVRVLSNGDYLVIMGKWDNGSATDVGAVAWGDGENGTVGAISPTNAVVGSTTDDYIGLFNITPTNAIPNRNVDLGNGNYVVYGSEWDNGVTPNIGAVRFCQGGGGCVGPITTANAFVGSTQADAVGYEVTILSNGNYVIHSPYWDDNTTSDVGAATWCSGITGCVGNPSSSNSLIGSQTGDLVSLSGVTALANGHYVVRSPQWDNDSILKAGAVTWGNGTTGIVGPVSSTNSLVGASTNDSLGNVDIFPFLNGDYVIVAPSWDNSLTSASDAGAAFFADSTTFLSGVISSANALVGTKSGDAVGSGGVTELANGNYAVISPTWKNASDVSVGAATWCNAETTCVGALSPSNSLVGSSSGDLVGNMGVVPLPNGNYVVVSPYWDNGLVSNVGAVTWGNGTTGITGQISPTNSIVGVMTNDHVGSNRLFLKNTITILTTGDYLVGAPLWDNPETEASGAGALRLAEGDGGTVGPMTLENTLYTSRSGNYVGNQVVALANGGYLVLIPEWYSPTGFSAGVVWSNVSDPVTGLVTNFVAFEGNMVSSGGAVGFEDGSFAVLSPGWEADLGAITMGNGVDPFLGSASAENSLIGSTYGNRFSSDGVIALEDGGYIVVSHKWDDPRTVPTILDMGMVVYTEGYFHTSPREFRLLKNGSFEVAGANIKQAQDWVGLNLIKSGDKRLCSTFTKPIDVAEGVCVFQFKAGGTPSKARSLKQILTGDELGLAGQTLTLSAKVEGLRIRSGGRVIMTVTYADNTISKLSLIIPDKVYDFTEITGILTLAKDVQKIVIVINVKKLIGQVRIDDMSLVLRNPERLALPVIGTRDEAIDKSPVVPDGFRR